MLSDKTHQRIVHMNLGQHFLKMCIPPGSWNVQGGVATLPSSAPFSADVSLPIELNYWLGGFVVYRYTTGVADGLNVSVAANYKTLSQMSVACTAYTSSLGWLCFGY